MKTLKLIPGTDEWHAARAKYFTASDAPAMMGASPYASRSQLLHKKKAGEQEAISPSLQKVYDRGHEVEALARPIAQEIIGEDLFQVVGVDDDDYLLASFDGLTMMETIAWECKQWNEQKATDVRAGKCPEQDYWQVVQQLYVSGAERCLYMVTDGSKENAVTLEVFPNQDDFDALLDGWKQFEKDLAEYVPREVKAEAVAEHIDQLPALNIQITGGVSASNLDAYSEAAGQYLATINTELTTDQHFADAEAAVKFLKKGESDLESAKKAAISQTADIETLLRTVDDIKEQMRQKRLQLEKLVKAEKENRKNEIVKEAASKLDEHVASLRDEVESLPVIVTHDFYGVIKGKKALASIQDAVDDELARCKIEADKTAANMRANLKCLNDSGEYRFLFNDLNQVINKPADDFAALVKSRVLEHKEAERQRIEAEKEKARHEEAVRQEAIRIEEAARQKREQDEREAQIRAEEERKRREGEERIRAEERARQEEQRQEEARKLIQEAAEEQQESGVVKIDNIAVFEPAQMVADLRLTEALHTIKSAAEQDKGFRLRVIEFAAEAGEEILGQIEVEI